MFHEWNFHPTFVIASSWIGHSSIGPDPRPEGRFISYTNVGIPAFHAFDASL